MMWFSLSAAASVIAGDKTQHRCLARRGPYRVWPNLRQGQRHECHLVRTVGRTGSQTPGLTKGCQRLSAGVFAEVVVLRVWHQQLAELDEAQLSAEGVASHRALAARLGLTSDATSYHNGLDQTPSPWLVAVAFEVQLCRWPVASILTAQPWLPFGELWQPKSPQPLQPMVAMPQTGRVARPAPQTGRGLWFHVKRTDRAIVSTPVDVSQGSGKPSWCQ